MPTNGVVAHAVDAGLFAEAAFGLALLIVPLVYLPELLYLPCWFLFAGKFLFGRRCRPFTVMFPMMLLKLLSLATVTLLVSSCSTPVTSTAAPKPPTHGVGVADRQFTVDGQGVPCSRDALRSVAPWNRTE